MNKLIIILLTSFWSLQASAGLLQLDWSDDFGGSSTTTESSVTLDTGGFGSAWLSSIGSYDFTDIDSMSFTTDQPFEGDDYFDQLWGNFYEPNAFDEPDYGAVTSFSNANDTLGSYGDEILFSIDALKVTLDLSNLVGSYFMDFQYWGDSTFYSLTNISFSGGKVTDPDNSTPVSEPSTLAIFSIALLMLTRRKFIN